MHNNKPSRKLTWLWRNEKYGYGVLSLSERTPRGPRVTEYFAQAVRGRMGRVWTLAELADRVGIRVECEVNLVGAMCTCGDFMRDNRCVHLDALNTLDHLGRL